MKPILYSKNNIQRTGRNPSTDYGPKLHIKVIHSTERKPLVTLTIRADVSVEFVQITLDFLLIS